MRHLFFLITVPLLVLIGAVGYFHPPVLWAYVLAGPLFLLGVHDSLQRRHTILRNFPVLGHLRYFFEFISPELQQYFIERDTDGKPFSRRQRELECRFAQGW